MDFFSPSRRVFLRYSALAAAGLPLLYPAFLAAATSEKPGLPDDPSIQDIIDMLIRACTGKPLPETVDTVKNGDPSRRCTGVVSTFLATVPVIRRTAELGANLIITHEPTFYNHLDQRDWLSGDPVYEFKKNLLEENGIVVWRFHDYWHLHQPDGILEGLLRELDWESYVDKTKDYTVALPEATSLRDLAVQLKEKLGLSRTFFIGNGEQSCRRIGLLPGAWGRVPQISALRRDDIDAIIVGEVSEWETAEWVRDAAAAGLPKGLVILGHARSEEPGMAYFVEWMKERLHTVPVHHVAAEDPFQPV